MRFEQRWSLLLAFLVFAAFTAWCHDPVLAQEARGTIFGKVIDASGGVVPGAAVELTNKAMGTKNAVLTNDEGFYQVSYLIPGLYQMTVELTGFKKHVRDDLQVRVNDRIELNVTLEVGEVQQVITVTGDTPLLNTATASMGQVVDSRRVADLPLAHGNPYALIGLANGASWNNTSATLNRPFEPTHIVGYAINGTRANRSDVMIDGVPSTATANANEVIAAYVPPTDIVAEFKVQTAVYDASFGNTEGGVANIVLKSGTNEPHGTAYWAAAPMRLAANEWFNNAAKAGKTETNYNRWGGSFGGPVWIPKLYDGRNRTFIMWGYEAIHETRPRNNNGTPTVPTAKMKTGDFSDLLTNGGTSYQIYNPFTRKAVAGGRYEQEPFAGNIIPGSLINPIAKKILEYYPDPVSPNLANSVGQNNMVEPSLPETITYYTHSFRGDHQLTSSQRLAMNARFYKRDSNYNNYLHSIASGEYFQFLSRAGGIDYVNTLSSTMVLNTRYGYNRFIRVIKGNPGAAGMDLTTLGFPGTYNDAIPEDVRRFPRINLTGYTGTGIGGEWRPVDTHVLAATMNKMQGSHALKTGIEFRAYRENDVFSGNDMTGVFNFDSTWTRGPKDNSATSPSSLGQSVAALLLGLPSPGSYVARSASYAEQSTNWGIFIQDDWKVNNRLTLNLGLRWEYEGPLTERFDRSVRGFDFTAAQPFEAAVQAAYAKNPTPEVATLNLKGGLTFAGVGGEPRGLYNTPKKNFAPQIGFAFKLTDKTVLRGGAGIFYGFLGQRRSDVVQHGFSANTQMNVTLDNGLTFIETLSNPFQSGLIEPKGAAEGTFTFVGQGISPFLENPLSPWNGRWQLGIQQEIGHGFVFDMAYVGNKGIHLPLSGTRNLNALPAKYLSTSPVRDDTTNNYLTANVPNPFYNQLPSSAISGLRGSNIARTRLLAPYPIFDSINMWTSEGYSWYHSLQTGVQKRFSQGYTVMANYTFSKFMQATELLNAGDLLPAEVISDHDTPHRLSVSGIWELPFGRSQALGSGVNPALSRIISGWQVQGIYAFQSARPIGNWGDLILNGNWEDVRLPSDQQARGRWFNTDAGFEKASAKQYASHLRTQPLRFGWLRNDNANNIDLSLIKNTAIAESKNLQFRAEFLNAFNHPNFAQPNLTATSKDFGLITGVVNYSRRIQISLKFVF